MSEPQSTAPTRVSGVLVNALQEITPIASFIATREWRKQIESRMRQLQQQIEKLESVHIQVNPEAVKSPEFHSLATRVVLAASKEHREEKQAMLAAVLVSSAGRAKGWPYEKKQLLADLVEQIQPYHVNILERCPRSTEKDKPFHVHRWDELVSIPDLPEPKTHILVNAVQWLSNAGLLTYIGGGHMMRGEDKEGNPTLRYVTYLPAVLEESKFARTRLGDDLLRFLMRPA